MRPTLRCTIRSCIDSFFGFGFVSTNLDTRERARDRAWALRLGVYMHTTILAIFFEISRTAISMCGAGILLFLVAVWAAKADIARAGGLDKIVALSNLCFAIPLAGLCVEHLSSAHFVQPEVD